MVRPFCADASSSFVKPSVTVSLANHDNNQHAEDENLRLGNLWDAIEIFAGLFTGEPET